MNEEEYMKLVVEKSSDKIKESEVFVSLVTENYLKSGKAAIELGLSIFYDKPIIMAVLEGTELPKKLVQVADKIVYYKSYDDMGQTLKKAIDDFFKEKDAK